MKAVLLAGGLGTRMREETEFKPKPMVEIGGMPVLWHIMKSLSHFGITEFVVLTGYKGEQIAEFFANLHHRTRHSTYDYSDSQPSRVRLEDDSSNWRVDLVRTGNETPTGGRLLEAKEVIGDKPFLCTYGDGLANVDIRKLVSGHVEASHVASMTVVQPINRFGVVDISSDDAVMSFREKPRMTDWINMGYFIFNPEIFDYLDANQMLEEQALINLAKESQLRAHKHFGFWEPMDTYREFKHLNALWEQGQAPWKNWS